MTFEDNLLIIKILSKKTNSAIIIQHTILSMNYFFFLSNNKNERCQVVLYTYEKRERKNNEQYGRPYEQITFRLSMFGYMTTIDMNIIKKKESSI
jgi:hypothetical protein